MECLIGESNRVIAEGFARASAPERVGISFNGGKDSVVMIELLLLAVGTETVQRCCVFYFCDDDEFEEMHAFRARYAEDRIGKSLVVVPAALGQRGGLEWLQRQFSLEVVFLGTRREDPSGRWQRSALEPTTPGWPPMLRVCPVLHWSYCDIWRFTRERGIPYCSLYERGFTSLGGRSTTVPNPHLRRNDSVGGPCYASAWELNDASFERSGRLPSAKLSSDDKNGETGTCRKATL